MGLEIQLDEEKRGEILIFKPRGHLDATTSPEMERHIFDHIYAGECKIVLDFSGVDHLSSAGMRMLLSTAKKMKTIEGGALVVAALNARMINLLKLAGFEHILTTAPTLEEALHRF